MPCFLYMHLTRAERHDVIFLQIHGVQDMFGGMFGQGPLPRKQKRTERIPTKHAECVGRLDIFVWADGYSSWEIKSHCTCSFQCLEKKKKVVNPLFSWQCLKEALFSYLVMLGVVSGEQLLVLSEG